MSSLWPKARDRQFPGLTEADNEHQWRGPFYFAVLSDPQLGMADNNGPLTQDIADLRVALRAVRNLSPPPRFLIICGDLVHAHTQLHPHLTRSDVDRQVNALKQVLAEDLLPASIPLVCVCGNHDVGNTPDETTIAEYRERFGDDYFGFWCGGMRGIVLNMQLYSDPSRAESLYKEQDAWFRRELGHAVAAKAKHVIVFGHIPWFLYREEEDDVLDEFSIYRGEKVPHGYFHIPQSRRLPAVQAMKDAGVRATFAGHWHQNGEAVSEPNADGRRMEMVITTSTGVQLNSDSKPGFRLVKVFENQIGHRFFPSDAVLPTEVDLQRLHAW